MHDAVGIDIEGYLDLRHAARCGRDAVQLEASQRLVVRRHFTFALQHVDIHAGLTVRRGGEHLRLLDRNGGIALDQAGEYAAQRFNAQRKRSYIQQDNILHIAAEYAALNGSADRYALIGVDSLIGLLAGDALYGFLNRRNTGGAAHQNDLIDIACGNARIAHRLTHGRQRLFNQISGQFVELRAGDGYIQMLRTGCIRGDEGQIYVYAHQTGKFDLRLFSGFLQTLQRHTILTQIDVVFLLEFFRDVVDQALVEIIAAQMGIAAGRQYFEDAVADFHQRYIERAAAQVVHQNLMRVALVQTVCQCGRGRLVDDTLYIQTRDTTRVLRRLTLRIGEVCRNGDDRIRHGFAQIAFGVRLQLLQDHRADFRRGVGTIVNVYLVIGAHAALDGNDGAFGVGNRLTLCHLTYQTFAVLCECYDGRRSARAFRVRDNNRFAAFHNGNAGIRSTKVNTNNLTHFYILLKSVQVFCWFILYMKLLLQKKFAPLCASVRAHLDHRIANDLILYPVALLEYLQHLAGRIARLAHDRVVLFGIEILAQRGHFFKSKALQAFHQHVQRHLNALGKPVLHARLFGGVQRAFQIIDGGQQRRDGFARALVIAIGSGGCISALEILEIRLRSAQGIQIFIPLRHRRFQRLLPLFQGSFAGFRRFVFRSGLILRGRLHGLLRGVFRRLIVFLLHFISFPAVISVSLCDWTTAPLRHAP